MIKSKGILTISMISIFAVESAYAAIASSGYVDQQVGTKISEVNATTVANDETANVVTSISAKGNTVTATKGITAEETKNKVKTIRTDGTATDTAYPSEKAVATALDAKQDKLEGEVLTNTATGSGSLSTGGANAIATNNSVAIGPGSTAGDASVSVGNNARSASSAIVIGSGSSLGNNVVIGTNAYGTGSDAVSIGKGAYSNTKSVAIGSGAKTQDASNMIAIGDLAKTSADYAIQLGDGTNSEANTFSVGLGNSNNYKLLGSDGKIPAERLPFTGDVLTNTATGSDSVSTGDASAASADRAVAIGSTASAGNSSIALGYGADASASNGVAIGVGSTAEGGATAVGTVSRTSAEYSVAIGFGSAASATRAIQIGQGTNSEANTLSVGLSDANNYKLLGSDGKIPAERLPAATASTLGGVKSGGDISISSTGAVSVVSALKAVQDANGANIAETYQKKDALVTSQNFDSNSATASDEKYTSEKAVATALDAKQDKLEGEVLTNTATGSGSLSIDGATPTSLSSAVVIGDGASATGNGNGSVAIGGGVSTTGMNAVALGTAAQSGGEYSVAVGSRAAATANNAIQIGRGTNRDANTLSVGLSDSNNYKLLGSDGKIPAERLPFTGDVLTNTATGSDSFSTGDANAASADRAVAIGSTASAGNSSIALGYGADASASTGVAIGVGSTAEGGATAVGAVSRTSAENSVAIGFGSAASATRAIQIGQGTNSEANTLSVGLDGTNNYKLLGSDGKIPAERLPVATSSTLGGVKSGGDISISSTGAVSVVSALKAVQDANGANIAATYATKASLNDLNNNKVQKDWTTSNVNKVLVIGSDSNYPDVYGKVTVAKITENFLDNAIKNKLSNAVTSVATSGSGAVVTGFSKSGNSMTVTKSNVKIPVGSATATTYATIWVE